MVRMLGGKALPLFTVHPCSDLLGDVINCITFDSIYLCKVFHQLSTTMTITTFQYVDVRLYRSHYPSYICYDIGAPTGTRTPDRTVMGRLL